MWHIRMLRWHAKHRRTCSPPNWSYFWNKIHNDDSLDKTDFFLSIQTQTQNITYSTIHVTNLLILLFRVGDSAPLSRCLKYWTQRGDTERIMTQFQCLITIKICGGIKCWGPSLTHICSKWISCIQNDTTVISVKYQSSRLLFHFKILYNVVTEEH